MHKILIYLCIIHLLKSSTCFEHCPAHLQEVYVVIVYMQRLVSSLSAGESPVHRLRKKLEMNQGYTTMHGQPIIKPLLSLVVRRVQCSVSSFNFEYFLLS
jgi:hypothetical protein